MESIINPIESSGWEMIEAQLPRSWKTMATTCGLFPWTFPAHLGTKFTDAEKPLRLVLHHVGNGVSLKVTAATAAAAGIIDISHVALHKWMVKIGPYLAELCGCLAGDNAAFSSDRWAGYEVMAVDASALSCPGAISLAFIPDAPPDFNACCAEHVEHQVLPSAAMGQKFVASHSAQRNNGDPEYDFYRIIAYGKGDDTPTMVTTNLPSPDDQFALAPGEFHEFFANTGFVVDADGPLHVAQFITAGSDIAYPIAGAGDPSLLFFPSVEQRRGVYVFATGEGFQSNWAVVSLPQNTPVKIDGKDLTSECTGPLVDGTLDGINYESWTCRIADGAHIVHSGDTPETADYPIAVSVYGYYDVGSYAYTAGSDLRKINPFVPE